MKASKVYFIAALPLFFLMIMAFLYGRSEMISSIGVGFIILASMSLAEDRKEKELLTELNTKESGK